MHKRSRKTAPAVIPADASNAVTAADAKRPVTGTHIQNELDVEAARRFSEENKK